MAPRVTSLLALLLAVVLAGEPCHAFRRHSRLVPRVTPKRGHVELPQKTSLGGHPLDPLSQAEILAVQETLLQAGLLELGKGQIRGVELQEPPKAVVLSWSEGAPLPPREALVVLWRAKALRTLTVDVTARKVVRDELYAGSGMPMIMDSDYDLAGKIAANYPPFQEAIAKRNLSVESVYCSGDTAGWYDKKSEEGRRILRLDCYDVAYTNFYMQPVEGISVYVDLDAEEVYDFFDTGVLPSGSPQTSAYTANEVEGPLDDPFKPISIEQPLGVNFKVEGYTISWAKWKFHARPDPRAGMIISRVTFNDTTTKTVRDVMYQGYLSEMFVPYQDPSPNWFHRTFMDAGEYGFGYSSAGLLPLNDCPRNAHFFDAVWADSDGAPQRVPKVMCVFEKYTGDAVWRHTEPYSPDMEGREVRPKVTLIARQAATIGNYDYTIDWEFQTDGLIRTSVTMSGMVSVKNTKAATVNDVGNDEILYGTMVNDYTVAVNHDHFINFRLDMDVDGPQNSFQVGKLVTRRVPPGTSWRKSFWEVQRFTPQSEREAQFNTSSLSPAEYFVVNENSETRLGNKRSYKLVPRTSGVPLNTEDDYPQIRAAWCKNAIWVTPYDPEEKWAGGLFPNQQHGEDTLATWTLKDRPVANTDLVVWYTIAYHHVPVQEDFPVMPSTLGGFDLKPANFFEANPAIKAQAFKSTDLPNCVPNNGDVRL